MRRFLRLIITLCTFLALSTACFSQIGYSYGSIGATLGFDNTQSVSAGAYCKFGRVGFSGYFTVEDQGVFDFCDIDECEEAYKLNANAGRL